MQSAANYCSKGFQIFFNDPSLNIKGKESVNTIHYNFVLPYPPTVYELYQKFLEGQKDGIEENSEVLKVERVVFGVNTNSEDELYVKYRLMAFKTLKKIGLQILQNTYSPEKTDRIVMRVLFFLHFFKSNIFNG